jgi:hypothetical protein
LNVAASNKIVLQFRLGNFGMYTTKPVKEHPLKLTHVKLPITSIRIDSVGVVHESKVIAKISALVGIHDQFNLVYDLLEQVIPARATRQRAKKVSG